MLTTSPIFQMVMSSRQFTPASISGLAAWWDASDATSLYQGAGLTTPVTSNGQSIQSWRDLSGNGKTLSQGTASARPTYTTGSQNGLAVATFDGDDVMTSGALVAQPLSIFWVGQTTADFTYFFDGSASNRVAVLGAIDGSTPNMISLFAGGAGITASHTYNSAFRIFGAVASGAGSQLYRDGELISAGDIGTQGLQDGFTLGNRYELSFFLTGAIGEFLIYGREVTAEERFRITNYLQKKWGTP